MDVLAAAYPATGQYESAVEKLRQAIALVDNQDRRADLQARLELYQSQRPFRESAEPSK